MLPSDHTSSPTLARLTLVQLLDRAEALRVSDPPQAYQAALRAHGQASAAQDRRAQALASLHAGSAASRLAQNAEAARWLRQAEGAFEELSDGTQVARARVRLAKVLGELGQYDEARTLLEQVEHDGTASTTERIDGLNLQGNIYVEIGDQQSALSAFERCLAACGTAGDDEGRAMVLGNLGNLWASLGDAGEAERIYGEALDIYRERGDAYNVVVGLLNLAEMRERLAYLPAALEAYEQAERAAPINAALLTLARAGQLRLLLATGRDEEALTVQRRGSAVQSGDDPRTAASWQLSMAAFTHRFGSPQQAAELADSAISQLSAHGVPLEVMYAHGILAQVLAAIGAFELAYRHLLRHHELEGAERARQFESRVHLSMLRLEMQRSLDTQADLLAHSETLAQQALEDPLTGLGNRRALDAALGRLLEAAPGQPFCVAMIDIDHFKHINDTYTHAAGDRVLLDLARRLKGVASETDVVARYGGEEFAVILLDRDLHGALAWHRTLRAALHAPWDGLPPDMAVTLSVGLCADTTLASGEAMLQAADIAMYAAKQLGRDRVHPASAE